MVRGTARSATLIAGLLAGACGSSHDVRSRPTGATAPRRGGQEAPASSAVAADEQRASHAESLDVLFRTLQPGCYAWSDTERAAICVVGRWGGGGSGLYELAFIAPRPPRPPIRLATGEPGLAHPALWVHAVEGAEDALREALAAGRYRPLPDTRVTGRAPVSWPDIEAERETVRRPSLVGEGETTSEWLWIRFAGGPQVPLSNGDALLTLWRIDARRVLILREGVSETSGPGQRVYYDASQLDADAACAGHRDSTAVRRAMGAELGVLDTGTPEITGCP